VLGIDFAAIAALVPLGTVLGFAALLLKRWWNQQDNAMAAAIEASNKEGAKCEERMQLLRTQHDREIAELRSDFERLQVVVRQLIPIVPPDVQTQLWDLMWSRNDEPNAPTRSPTAAP
jgi:hypothetical protein